MIANRKAEHLGTTDRGVVMFRRMLARGIDAIEKGETLTLPREPTEGPVRTYTHELVFDLPSQSSINDLSSLASFGRRAAAIVIETDHLDPIERETVATGRIRQMIANELVA